ncbi:MAG: hypothetical protein ABS882_00750, partial [Lysinibacillus sp.]
RKLAEHTKTSTETVATLLKNTDEQTKRLVTSISEIQSSIETGGDNMGQTAEQFTKITQSMLKTKEQNRLIQKQVAIIEEIMNQLSIAFDEVTHSADNLAGISKDLQ